MTQLTQSDMETYERGKLDGQILQELRDVNAHLQDIQVSIKGQETRIRVLENWRWWLLGSSIATGVGAAKIAQAMMSL